MTPEMLEQALIASYPESIDFGPYVAAWKADKLRLEAAEKLVADTFAYLTKWGELGWMRAADEDEGTNLADRLEAAALAGEKP